MTFDKVSKKKATDCTPAAAKIELNVIKTTDPITKNAIYIAPDGYDASKDDDIHKCTDVKPKVAAICVDSNNNISVRVSKGTHGLETLDISVNGNNVASLNVSGSGTYPTNYNFTEDKASISATVSDTAFYADTKSYSYQKADAQNGRCGS